MLCGDSGVLPGRLQSGGSDETRRSVATEAGQLLAHGAEVPLAPRAGLVSTVAGHLVFATSVHLAIAGAPVAVTAGADTPLLVNAGPGDPSPAIFESASRVEIDERPELRGLEGRRPSRRGDAHPSPSGAGASRQRPARRAPLTARSASLAVGDEMPVEYQKQGAAGRRARRHLLLLHAWSGSAGVDAVVTASVLATRRSSVSASSNGRTDPAQPCATCAFVAIRRAVPTACRGPCSRFTAGTHVAAPRHGRKTPRSIHVIVWNPADRSSITAAAVADFRIGSVRCVRAINEKVRCWLA